MIKITSHYVSKNDREFLKKFSKFVLSKMLRSSVIRKADISIRIVKRKDMTDDEDHRDLKDYGAWVINEGTSETGRKRFSVILNATHMNRKAKKQKCRLRKLMYDLAHELVHIKQYLNNELFDYVDNAKVRYKGEVFQLDPKSEEDYYNSPWEIEAYGREHGMYKMFCNKLKEEAKASK